MRALAQLRQLGLFDARVPRYTSYPTSPHFNGDVGVDDVAGWLASIRPGSTVSLYVHVPFCRRLCWFCACRTQGTSTLAPVEAYVGSLKAELATIGRHLPDGVRLEFLHWGGGTPTILSPALIADLAAAITAAVPLAENAQFSVEIDPSEIDPERLAALAAAGMNRASIGVQDFDPDIQAMIGREQGYEITHQTVEGLRAVGITSLNMDILYGLPDQTPERIAASVQKVLSLGPDRIALYGYAHVPWMSKRQALIPDDRLPSTEQRLELFETARALFVADGYAEIGIDHFARPTDGLAVAQAAGRLHRNFQGYTEDVSNTLIGVGASAISRYPDGYAQNSPATAAYQAAVRAGGLSTARGHRFSDDDRLRGRMIEALMCDFALSVSAIAAETGADAGAVRAILAPVPDQFDGMVAFDGECFEIRPEARPLARMIARALDAYEMAVTGHSPAI